MAKKKKTQEQSGAKPAKYSAKTPDTHKIKKTISDNKRGQLHSKDSVIESIAAKPKDLPPIEMAKVATDAPDNTPKVKPLPEAKAEVKIEAESTTPSDLTPQLVKRVHELYEELGREEVRAVQDWDNKKGKVQKPKAESEAKHDVQAEPKPEAKTRTYTR